MLATPGPLPSGDGWAFELKWDGIRLLGELLDGRLRLHSRGGVEHTARWPALAALADLLPAGRTVLDGELVAFDDAGRPSFGTLMAGRGVAAPTWCLFDLPVLAGEDLTGRPWTERRAALTGLGLEGPAWRTPGVFDDGPALAAATAADGLEGVVAKRRTSPYRPGERSRDWIKLAHRRTTSVVIGGWQPGAGHGGLRSLVVGTPTATGPLVPAGSVGSGLSGAEAAALLTVLAELARPTAPFDPVPALPEARWVEPCLVIDVEHLGRTDGALLRQPVFVRARPDLDAADLLESGAG
jgi:bifunctional non-homologous end joining protein LigD